MSGIRITRESILDGSLHAVTRAAVGPGVRYMTDEERVAHVREMIASAPRPDRIWVFGFGSLMWNPAFHFVERRNARIHGFHRDFCLYSRTGRGSPECPGLMLALEPGGSCHGVAYRLAPEAAPVELDVIWRREMGSMAYRAVWVAARTAEGIEPAIAFAANREHERYIREMADDEAVRLLATGVGAIGRCCDYLFDTVAHLRDLGVRDRRLERLAARVRRYASEPIR